MKSNFNLIAPFYDQLVSLVFGRKLKDAQSVHLNLIPKSGHVLIMGGGTGQILTELYNRDFCGKITYVEASEKMINQSRKRVRENWDVLFICGDEQEIPSGKYDVIITSFFLDVFATDRLKSVIALLKSKLKVNGLWCCTDFKYTNKLRHKLLIWVMLLFFKIVANLEASLIPDFDLLLKESGLSRTHFHECVKGLVFSSVYTST